MPILGIILAAGKGTRFKSGKPKVIHRLLGKPMVFYPYNALMELNPLKVGIVVGYQANLVKEELKNYPKVEFFHQENPKGGTGDAVKKALPLLERYPEGVVFILNGDSPLITSQTLKEAYQKFLEEKLDGLIFTTFYENPTGYGRILRDKTGNVVKIVEEKDATKEQKEIKEVNGGFYIFRIEPLIEALKELKPSLVTNEVYLTDVVEIFAKKGLRMDTYPAPKEELLGVNDRVQFALAEKLLLERKIKNLQKEGVTIRLPETVYIEWDVSVGRDCEIEPNVSLKGNTKIEERTFVGQGSIIENSKVGRDVKILPYSYISDSIIEAGAVVGPFARLRNRTHLKAGAEIGNFVEVKSSTVGENTKAKHLTYIGDATIGKDSNIGAGTVFANYDGVKKYQTVVGNNVFIGSNSLIIAPRKLEDWSFIAGGSVVNKDIPKGALAISRPPLKILENKNPLLKKKKA